MPLNIKKSWSNPLPMSVNFIFENGKAYYMSGNTKTAVDSNDDGVICTGELEGLPGVSTFNAPEAKGFSYKYGGDNYLTSHSEFWKGLQELANDKDNDIDFDNGMLGSLGDPGDSTTKADGVFEKGAIYQDTNKNTLFLVVPNSSVNAKYDNLAKHINDELYGGKLSATQLTDLTKRLKGSDTDNYPLANTEIDLKKALQGFSGGQPKIFSHLDEPKKSVKKKAAKKTKKTGNFFTNLLGRLGGAKKVGKLLLILSGVGLVGGFDWLFGQNSRGY